LKKRLEGETRQLREKGQKVRGACLTVSFKSHINEDFRGGEEGALAKS